jgi:hypothetical protein
MIHQTKIVQEQILEAMKLAKHHNERALDMMTCDHAKDVLELENTFKPRWRVRCVKCRCFLS